jgi:16S rRNA (cytosine967-C5)-methyltransferase
MRPRQLAAIYKAHADSQIACRVRGGLQNVLQSTLFREGAIAVQDQAADLVVHLLDTQSGETILDTCAAPGS